MRSLVFAHSEVGAMECSERRGVSYTGLHRLPPAQTVEGKGRSWETREEVTALVTVGDDGG